MNKIKAIAISLFLAMAACSGEPSVKIGNQVWMSKNLNRDLPGSKCYGNDPANCQKYGRLYDWETAKTACPKGWHLPSDAEWQALVDFAGGEIAGKTLKARSGWAESGNGTDIYGFSALPGGYGYSSGDFYDVGYVGCWWSSTEDNASHAWNRNMTYDGAGVLRYNYDKSFLYSVRCAQD